MCVLQKFENGYSAQKWVATDALCENAYVD